MKGKATAKMHSFYINDEGVAYEAKVAVNTVNEQQHFIIRINNGPEHAYVWDDSIQAITPLDDEAATIPQSLEKALSDQLMKTVVIH